MNPQISAVLTATEFARSLRATISTNLSQQIEISVEGGDSINIVFRVISGTVAIGTTNEGNEAIVSLGGEAELDTKHPTIVVSAAPKPSN